VERIRFRTEDGLWLEGEIRMPDDPPLGGAVLCHPHPRHGGSKDHPLLWAIRNELAGRGFAVLSFNFRGILGSEGKYGGGVDEVVDVRAAVGRVREAAEGPSMVCGWSFGAHVALRTAVDDERIAALALVGCPLADSSLVFPPLPAREDLRRFDRPVLLVSGQADQFSPAPDLRALSRKLPRSTLHVVPNTDHFFWRREREVAALIGTFAATTLPGG
jgi:alpha/beta superfamily hydrolase